MSGGDQGPKVALKKILVQEFPKQKREGREVHPCFRGKTVGPGVAQTNKAAFDEAYKTAGTWRDLAIAVHEWAERTTHAEFPHPGAWEPGMEAGKASPEWAPYAQRITDTVAELAESGLEKYSFLGLSVVIIGSVVRRWMGTVMRTRRAAWFARCRRKVHHPCHRPEDTAGRCRIR